jgi:hypothetical protein
MPNTIHPPLKPKRRKRTSWVNRFLKLPASIKAKIEALDITPTQKSHVYKLLAVIMIKAKRKGGVFKEIDLPWEYMQRGWGGSAYKLYLNVLIKEGIIGCDYIKRVSNNKTGKCYRYWLVYKEEYQREELVSASYLSTSSIDILDSEVFENWFKEDFKQLEIPMETLRGVAKARVEGVSLGNCRIGNEIEGNSIDVTVVEGKRAYSYRTSKQNALRKAEGLGKLLIIPVLVGNTESDGGDSLCVQLLLEWESGLDAKCSAWGDGGNKVEEHVRGLAVLGGRPYERAPHLPRGDAVGNISLIGKWGTYRPIQIGIGGVNRVCSWKPVKDIRLSADVAVKTTIRNTSNRPSTGVKGETDSSELKVERELGLVDG